MDTRAQMGRRERDVSENNDVISDVFSVTTTAVLVMWNSRRYVVSLVNASGTKALSDNCFTFPPKITIREYNMYIIQLDYFFIVTLRRGFSMEKHMFLDFSCIQKNVLWYWGLQMLRGYQRGLYLECTKARDPKKADPFS